MWKSQTSESGFQINSNTGGQREADQSVGRDGRPEPSWAEAEKGKEREAMGTATKCRGLVGESNKVQAQSKFLQHIQYGM